MQDKRKVCCFSGHRNLPFDEIASISVRLDETIGKLIREGVVYYGVGGALGFDTLAAQAVLRAKERNPTVKLIMVLPCRNQHARWNAYDKQAQQRLLSAADKTVCLSEFYYDGCMKKRNLHLIQHSGICVAYMKDEKSGSAQTVRLAKAHGLSVINLAERNARA